MFKHFASSIGKGIRSNRTRLLLAASAAILTTVAFTLAFVGANDASLVQQEQLRTSQKPRAEAPKGYRTPLSEQRLTGGFWRVDHTFTPFLIITSFIQNAELPVTPVLYAADGTEYGLPPVTLGPGGVSFVDIIAALNSAPDEIKAHFSEYGSAGVKYVWHSAGAVSAIVQNRDAKRSLNFNFELRSPMLMKHGASTTVKEGLWWKEDSGVKGFLGLTNIAHHPIDVQVQVLSDFGNLDTERTIELQPIETRVLDLLGDSQATSGGIRVAYNGSEKDIVLAGGLENPRAGYSAQIPFTLPQATPKPSTVAVSSVGLMLGTPDPMMKFPVKTEFGVYLALRNTTERSILVKPTAYYMQGNQAKVINLQTLALSAGQARHWRNQEFLKEAGLPAFSGMLNLVFSYQGGPSDLLMASGSIDQTKTYVFESVMKAVGTSNAKGLKAWDVSNGNDTMISLLSLSDKDQDLLVTFFFDGGRYKYPAHLQAGASTTFNVSEIIMKQQPDADGNKIPLDVSHGSAVLAGPLGYTDSINVAVSVGVFNVSTATCGTTCPTCFGFSDYQVLPHDSNSSTAAVGGTATFVAWGYGQDNYWHNVTYQSFWDSDNSNVATSQGSGQYNGVSPGTFDADANADLIDVNADCPEGTGYPCPTTPYFASAGGNIIPRIDSIDPTFLNAGDTGQSVTIHGAGFGPSPTVNLPSGVSSNNQQDSTDSTIVLPNVSVAASTYIGPDNITVTASGQTSAPSPFTIDGPDHMVVQNDVLGTCSGCATTVDRVVTFQVIKFSGTPVFVIPIGEVPTRSGWTCNQAEPGIIVTLCVDGGDTSTSGTFRDEWTLGGDGYTPSTGCGWNFTTHWQWCSAPKTVGTLTGYTHNNAISENGVVNPPNQFTVGTPIYP